MKSMADPTKIPSTEVKVEQQRGGERSVAAAQEAVREQRPLGLLLQRDAEMVEPGPADLYQIGTTARILRYLTTPAGSHNAIAQAEQRFRVLEFIPGYPFLVA